MMMLLLGDILPVEILVLYLWIDRQMNGCMDRWMDVWINRWMDGQIDGWVNGWMDGQIDGRMDRYESMDRWIGGWIYDQLMDTLFLVRSQSS